MKYTQRFIRYVPVLIILVVLATSVSLSGAPAVDALTIQQGADSARGENQASDLFGATGIFKTITDVLLFVLGAVSVIMIIIGGLRYVISGGDSGAVSAAKNTILYAIVGVIVALLAYAAIDFVIESFTPGGSGGGGTAV